MEQHSVTFQPDNVTVTVGDGTLWEAQIKAGLRPDAPCRFPERMVSSMEAYGMLVLEVCKLNGLQYYYGSDKMANTGCFLVK